jgi:hypothetical protein
MPRDFVPCLYHERIEAHPLSAEPALCCDVIELHAICDVQTHAPQVIIGTGSRQYTMRDTYSVAPQADLADTQRIGMRVLLRREIFRTFYAAMAALE